MDLSLLLKVLGRHRSIVAAGVGLAVVLAGLSYASPAVEGWKPVLKYRQQEQWQSQARVLVTLRGFSSGRSLARGSLDAEPIQRAEQRLSALALLYAGLANGDEITRIVRSEGPIRGRVIAQAATVSGGSATLPIVDITAISPSGAGSRDLANRFANALKSYVKREQNANRVPPRERVSLGLLNRGGGTQLVAPRKTTLPIIVLLAILSATAGLVFVVENLRRRASAVEESSVVELEQRPDPQAMTKRW